MAELRAYDPSWRDRLAQFFIGDEKPSEMKRRAVLAAFGSTGLGNEGISLSDATPLGMLFSGNDAVRSAQNGHYGEAALNALGAVPSGIITGATLKAIKGIKQGENLASKGTFIHNAPEVKPRPFELDYPNGAPADATGKLTHDIDGRELTAKYVAGRKTVGGSDAAIPTEEYDALAEAATGRRPQAVASRQIGGDAGQYVVTTDRRSGNVIDREIFIDKALPPRKAENVLAHEIGHAIDEISGKMPIDGLNQELRTVYNGQNNPQSHGKLFGPENAGYRTKDEVRKELVGEAIRSYKQNANYIKTVAPNTAARIREFVNSHPTLKHIIQFNSVAAAGGAGAAAMMPDEAKAAPVKNLLENFMDQRETIGNLLGPFLGGQPQQFQQLNPNMLMQAAEAAQAQQAQAQQQPEQQQAASPLPAPIDIPQRQVAEPPQGVDPMQTGAMQQPTPLALPQLQAIPQQPPQSKSGGFFDGLSKFGESDFGQRLTDMFNGWGMGSTMQDSLSKGTQMIAAGNQGRKDKKAQFSTIEWLKGKGMDEDEAKYLAGNSQALTAYLQSIRKSNDPMQALNQRKTELEIQKLENPPSKYGFTTLPDGTVVKTNEATGSVDPVFQSGTKPTADIQEYEYAKGRGYDGDFVQFQLDQKKAGAGSTNVTVGEGDKFYEALDKKNAETFSSLSDTGVQARSKLSQIDRLRGLMDASPSGASAAMKLAAGEYGIKTEGLDDLQASQALINELVPQQRQPGSGPMSDADLALFKQSLPRAINTPDGNKLILDTMTGIAQYQIQMGDIADQVANREITAAQGRERIKNLKNPLEGFKKSSKDIGAAGNRTSSGIQWSIEK